MSSSGSCRLQPTSVPAILLLPAYRASCRVLGTPADFMSHFVDDAVARRDGQRNKTRRRRRKHERYCVCGTSQMERNNKKGSDTSIPRLSKTWFWIWGLIKIMGPFGVCIIVYTLQSRGPKGTHNFDQPPSIHSNPKCFLACYDLSSISS